MDTAQASCQICISKKILQKWKEKEDAQIALYTDIYKKDWFNNDILNNIRWNKEDVSSGILQELFWLLQ